MRVTCEFSLACSLHFNLIHTFINYPQYQNSHYLDRSTFPRHISLRLHYLWLKVTMSLAVCWVLNSKFTYNRINLLVFGNKKGYRRIEIYQPTLKPLLFDLSAFHLVCTRSWLIINIYFVNNAGVFLDNSLQLSPSWSPVLINFQFARHGSRWICILLFEQDYTLELYKL